MLRTAAYLIASTRQPSLARALRQMLIALAEALAELRAVQARRAQAAAALSAAAGLDDIAAAIGQASIVLSPAAAAAFPHQPTARRPSPAPGPAARPRPPESPGQGGVPVVLKKFPTNIPLTCDNVSFADSR
jgi:hypothetical protein